MNVASKHKRFSYFVKVDFITSGNGRNIEIFLLLISKVSSDHVGTAGSNIAGIAGFDVGNCSRSNAGVVLVKSCSEFFFW